MARFSLLVLVLLALPASAHAQKIYRFVNGVPTEIQERDPARRYRMVTGPEGLPAYFELTTAEESARTAELNLPPPPFSGLGRVIAQRAGQTLANNTAAAIDFTNEVRDVGGYHDNANPDRFVVPVQQDGLYDVRVTIRFNESTAAGGCTANSGDRLVQVRAGGSPVATTRVRAAAASDTEFAIPAGDLELVQGDVVRVFAAQNCGGTLTIDARISMRRLRTSDE